MLEKGEYRAPQPAGTVLDIGRLFRAVWRNALPILTAALLVSLLMAARCAYFEKPTYRSAFTLAVSNKSSDIKATLAKSSDLSASARIATTYVETMRSSKDFVRAVIQKAGLEGTYSVDRILSSFTAERRAEDTTQVAVAVTMNRAEDCVRIACAMADVITDMLPEIIRGSSVMVLTSPLDAASRSTADVKGNAMKGFLFGLAAALVLVVLADIFDRRVWSVRELGSLAFGRDVFVIPATRSETTAPVGDDDPRYRDAFKLMRVKLSSERSGTGRALGVTSAEDAAGKSTAAVNLAVVAAARGEKAVVVDANFRKPSVGAMTGCESGAGFCDVLAGKAAAEEAVVRTSFGFDVVTAGGLDQDPTRLLDSEAMNRFAAALREKYDWVIVDLPGSYRYPTDVLLCSESLDGILFVVRESRSDLRKIRKTIERIEQGSGLSVNIVYNGAGDKKI